MKKIILVSSLVLSLVSCQKQNTCYCNVYKNEGDQHAAGIITIHTTKECNELEPTVGGSANPKQVICK